MYLKRIEIYGFKSFAQKSVLDFEYKKAGNVTAIVGPNGSGKSNVADAIRWVTGDQSSKNLRSKKSEDIIFCGSSAKPRGSYAEVTIVLSDDHPVKFDLNGKEFSLTEIEVARKIYRSGESEYLINRKKVRLTDIQQLLASLGFGQSSYTVIGQGMVDRLLFFTASERKVLFDEAAGVKQYEIKREQSLRKLESTDANLIRLRDILTELEPRVVNLRRLVKRAEGRKELEAEIKEVHVKYYGSLLAEYNAILQNVDSKKASLTKRIQEIDERVMALTEKYQSEKGSPYTAERQKCEAEIRHEGEKRDKLREEVAYLRGQIESAKRNIEQIEQKHERLETEKVTISESIRDLETEIKEAEKAILVQATRKESEQTKLSEIESQIEKLDYELANPKADKQTEKLAALESKHEELEAKKQEANNKLYSLRQEASNQKAQQEQAENALKSAHQELSSLKETTVSVTTRFSDLEAEKKRLAAEIKSKESELSKVSKALSSAEEELHLLAQQVTETNLTELEGEIGLVAKSHKGIFASILAAKNSDDLESIKSEVKDFGANLDKMISRFRVVTKAVNNKERERIENLLLEARGKTAVATNELQKMQFELVRIESEMTSAEEKVNDLKERTTAKEKEIAGIKVVKSSTSSETLENDLVAQLGALSAEIAEVSSEIRKHSGAVSERQNAILREKDAEQLKSREQRQILHNLEMELSRKESLLSNMKAELAKMISRQESIIGELSDLGNVSNSSDSTSTDSELVAKQKELSKIEEDIAKLRGGLTQYVAKEREHEQRGYALEREKRDSESEKQQIMSQLSALEVDSAKASVRLEDAQAEVKASNIDLPENKKFESLDQMEKDVLKLKMDNIRRKLENTAGIDPETEAEYHELEARATEMSTQVEDLTKAKQDLEKVVRELDARIKNQFADVFKNIASEFNRYFTMLFNGGNAKLSLGEDEEGGFGIEISANPPGKRVQSLTALSGGERTLTSLALLFAILSVNPSPFVVLDEVDAALDESNTVRFIKILEDLAKKTQFIIISHNRDTMKSASSLYGVTMDESHISKLLSVKLVEALSAAK